MCDACDMIRGRTCNKLTSVLTVIFVANTVDGTGHFCGCSRNCNWQVHQSKQLQLAPFAIAVAATGLLQQNKPLMSIIPYPITMSISILYRW